MAGEHYPSVRTYFCMHFAKTQPAPRGGVFVHCGGPSSMSDCVGLMGPLLGDDNYQNQYNTISMDQRGLGRSFPNFAHPKCTMTGKTAFNGAQEPALYAFNVDATNDAQVNEYLDNQIARAGRCWTEVPDFVLPATSGDKKYHFLDFSGTQEAIEDLDRFRQAMGMKLISLYGISYGTQIVAAYATAFPGSVDKFVVDSNVTPQPDMLDMGTDCAKNTSMMMNYAAYQCSAANAIQPGKCPTADAGQCIAWVSDEILKLYKDGILCCSPDEMNNMLVSIASNSAVWPSLEAPCKAHADNSPAALEAWLESQQCAGTACQANTRRRAAECEGEACASQPTSKCSVYGNPEYGKIMGGCGYPDYSAIPQTMIMTQTTAGQCYDRTFFLQQVKEINIKYPGLNTHNPSKSFMFWYGLGLYWPKSNPITPAGNPIQRGIVAGVMFDYATPYPWTQKMKAAFPMATMISSQGKGHGTQAIKDNKDDRGPCNSLIQNYFTTGSVEVVDGYTCRSTLPGPFPV